ncbi:MAG: alpha-2-macroglobulin family protein [Bacteroidetes bacterium]|nr:alpha-2-macroglobulin family protein [Bacteroidota bacterium]
MRIKVTLLTTATVVIFLLACNRNFVALDYTNAKDEVPTLGNLIFRFNKSLVNDSLVNRWDSVEYVSFEPKIPGRFRWEHPDELVFSPSRPLSPATTFKATLKSDVLQFSKFSKVEKAENLIFHTPELKLENASTTWVLQDENKASALPQVDLSFNYSVNPNTLKEKLKIEVNGQPANYTMQTLSSSSRILLQLQNIKMEDEDYPAKIIIEKNLVPDGGTNGTPEKSEISSVIPSPYVLRINDVTAEPNNDGGTIKVTTSQQIKPEQLSSFIKISPAVKFKAAVVDDGFTITSDDFNTENGYALTISNGIKGKIGGTLRDEYTTNVAFGKIEPTISFANSKGVYLSSKGERNMEVKLVNTPRIKIVISKIYENNLLTAQHYGYYPKDNQSASNSYRNEGDDEEESDYRYNYNSDDYSSTLGDIIYEKEIDTRSLPKYGNSRLFNFVIDDKIKDLKGIYHVMIRSTKDYWIRDSRFVSLSDIGLIAKEGIDRMVVFANSIKNATAMQGVNIVAYGANNQVLGLGTTNTDGVAEIAYSRKEFAGFKPAMIVAKTEDDFNYLPFTTTKVNTSRFEVGGKHINSTGLDAYVYPERDIYRPGEKLNFSVIVRDRQWKSPGDIPIKLKFLMPNGKELKEFRKNLNEQGSLEGNIDLATSAITGSYSLEVYSSNDILLTTQAFRIEEFVPDRIKVTTKLNKESFGPGDDAVLDIHAVNFFGPPAANRNYECEIQVAQKTFNPKKFNGYDFSLGSQTSISDKVNREGKTDDKGDAEEKYTVPAMFKNLGILQANFYSTVFDETGRPVSRKTSADIFTQPVFYGIGYDDSWYHALNVEVKFPIVALDKNEKVLSGQHAKVDIIKYEYRNVLSKSGSYFRYQSQKADVLVLSKMITVDGETTNFSFTPKIPGEYEIRVSAPEATSYVSRSFYSYGSWGSENSSFEVNNEGNIDISLDKSSYFDGENLKALFKTPFSGRMLVTMETEKLISYQYVNVEKNTASLDLKLTAESVPNVYITATLIKPHDITDMPLTVAHGFESVKVEEKERKIAVQINAEKTTRSRTHQKVTVKALPNSMVTLAAVDNGILQVSNFDTPDPYEYFYAKRALEVSAFDIYPLLFPELKARLSSTGGDSESDMTRRVNPMPAKRFKLVSYWSGIKQANSNGEAAFEFDIPQFSGEIRLMAVAYKNESFGSKESKMTVADPLVLSTALPRFLSPGDSISVPVTVTNTTAKTATANAQIKTSGTVQFAGGNQLSVNIPPNSESRLNFTVIAQPALGTGKVLIEINSMGEKFTDETEISVRPASSLQKITGSGSVNGGTSQVLPLKTNDFIASSVKDELFVSKSPAIELSKYLDYLVTYPYGCTEQTVSAAFPQLYYGDIADLLHVSRSTAGANANIQEAIRKIKMRQLYNGAVTLWDGEGTENWWCTIYAAHFLLEAQKAGYDVDRGLIETMLSYINNQLKNRKTIVYYYNRNQNKKIAPKEVVYGLYVLALSGHPNVSVMNFYKSNPELLSLDCKYMLSAAYALAGDKNSFKQFLPSQFAGEESVAQTGGSFYSDIRDESLALDVLLDVDPDNAQIPLMAKHVSDKLKQRYWWSTQELSFSFLALGKISKQAAKSTATAEIKVDGKTVGTLSGNDIRLTTQQLKGNNVEIVTKGNGRLYYFWQSSGISASGAYKEEDSYLKVRKHFYDRYGRLITGNTFKQNDLVIVQITLEKSYSTDIDNVVITDLLPAGFEIENPRTKEIPGMDWIKDGSTPTALDVRDDRINLFVDANSSKQTYYYAVRAVSPGVYRMGPVNADAMYNGEYHSYNGAGVIKVVR